MLGIHRLLLLFFLPLTTITFSKLACTVQPDPPGPALLASAYQFSALKRYSTLDSGCARPQKIAMYSEWTPGVSLHWQPAGTLSKWSTFATVTLALMGLPELLQVIDPTGKAQCAAWKEEGKCRVKHINPLDELTVISRYQNN